MKQWFSLSLSVPRELAEPVSNFLMETGSTGIEEIEEGLKQERLKAYFLQEEREQRVLRSLRRYLKSLQKICPELPPIEIETVSISEQDWGENWKQFFKPIRVGSRFVVKPPWAKVRLKKNEVPVEINPGMAFGTGTHASTRLCLMALEKRLKKRGLSVLDVGTGSGILSIASGRLGADEVWGIDTDRMAVEIARENVTRNQVSDRVQIRPGSIGNVRRKFDLVVANLDFKSLMRTRMALIRHLKKYGILILSGVLEREEERIRQHYIGTRLLKWVETDREGEWVCLTFQKR
jgi:ribosomal protein L11 methyltransferase